MRVGQIYDDREEAVFIAREEGYKEGFDEGFDKGYNYCLVENNKYIQNNSRNENNCEVIKLDLFELQKIVNSLEEMFGLYASVKKIDNGIIYVDLPDKEIQLNYKELVEDN